MNIVEATRSYEQWLVRQTTPIKGDLLLKHEAMREDILPFFRATYYRWAQIYNDCCDQHAKDTVVLAVGDLHIENFGTWRDSDARLVWGVNDFDECHPLPFTFDLIRLATSAYVAGWESLLDIGSMEASNAILEGYVDCLKAGGKPLVLSDQSSPLRSMARDRLEHPERFWKKLLAHPPVYGVVPKAVIDAITRTLPSSELTFKFLHRIAGMGSLGRERYTGVGFWQGGQIAREAKPVFASASHWALRMEGEGQSYYQEILQKSVRCPDPFVSLKDRWLIRRLSPDCFRIELSHLPKKRDEKALLYHMGWETANIHMGSRNASSLMKSLEKKPGNWLHKAAKVMREQVIKDWRKWRKH